MTRVAVTLSFDLLHNGHIDHLEKAHKLGDSVVIIVDPDEFLIAKKGYALQPFESRFRIACFLHENIPWIECPVVSIDKDGTCAETLRMIRPDILAKGGDRSGPDCMPTNEIAVCQEIGCRIVYGIGDLLNSSSALVAKAAEKMTQNTPKPSSDKSEAKE